MKNTVLLWLLAAAPLLAQAGQGTLRVHVMDTTQHDVPGAMLELSSVGTGARERLFSDAGGSIRLKQLPFGEYAITLRAAGYAPQIRAFSFHSAIPVELTVVLSLPQVTTRVDVASSTLLDAHSAASPAQIGRDEIVTRVSSLPGRSLQDLVNTQPGWLYEGNAVLHPRGSEYQTQVVLDGLPLLDNRSPGFGPAIEADTAEALQIYTAGIPAEYGRKMGGVIELTTRRQQNPGWHGDLQAAGGSFDAASYFVRSLYTQGRNSFGVTASNGSTSHFLNPVVPQNFTNKGSTGDLAFLYDRAVGAADHLSMSLRREFTNFEVPNELLQQNAGQLQHGDNHETIGDFSYQHLLSARAVLTMNGMLRDNAHGLASNAASTPIDVTQQNSFREGYGKGTFAWSLGRQEWKAGVESDSTFLHEHFADTITDASRFDEDTAPAFAFTSSRPDLEQAAFVEDHLNLGRWTVSAGLRWDLYQLLLHRQAFSPRLAVARSFERTGTVVHFAYDRVFQTPSSENILLSGSPELARLNAQILRLPVEPSRGNYYELGLTQSAFSHVRLDAKAYRRDVDHFADDDQLLNTAISYPIAFSKANIYGGEGKLSVAKWGRASGYVSYSYMVGEARFPVTGGLFLGDDVEEALAELQGRFPVSQDQRHTLRTRVLYRATSRLSLGSGLTYGSGLPFEFTGSESDALATEGEEVVSHVDLARGRVRPNMALSASAIADLFRTDRVVVRLQADGDNLSDRLNVLDFGGLFSGTAIAPARSVQLRLSASF